MLYFQFFNHFLLIILAYKKNLLYLLYFVTYLNGTCTRLKHVKKKFFARGGRRGILVLDAFTDGADLHRPPDCGTHPSTRKFDKVLRLTHLICLSCVSVTRDPSPCSNLRHISFSGISLAIDLFGGREKSMRKTRLRRGGLQAEILINSFTGLADVL